MFVSGLGLGELQSAAQDLEICGVLHPNVLKTRDKNIRTAAQLSCLDTTCAASVFFCYNEDAKS